jgi:hypothetical protein
MSDPNSDKDADVGYRLVEDRCRILNDAHKSTEQLEAYETEQLRPCRQGPDDGIGRHASVLRRWLASTT